MNSLFKKCNHHWVLLLEQEFFDADLDCIDPSVTKYYLYCPKCGKKKNKLSRKKYLLIMNEQKIRESYEK